MRAAIYARASVDRDDRRVSVDRQVDRCRDLAHRLDLEVHSVHVDNDRSGTTTTGRSGYADLVAVLEAGDVDTVVVHEQSRLTRDVGEWDRLCKLLASAGIAEIHTVMGGPIGVGDSNRLIGDIFSAVSRDEAAKIRARTKAAHAQLAKEGRFTGGVPYGYRRTLGDDGRGTIEPDPDTAPVVRRMVDWHLQGVSLGAIAARLNEQGVPTSRGGREWRRQSVAAIITSPTISGMRVHHGQPVASARWEPIITASQRAAIEARTSAIAVEGSNGRTYRISRAPSSRRSHLLTGVAACDVCGATVRCSGSSRRNTAHVSAYGCPNRHLTLSPAGLVDEFVVAAVRARLAPDDIAGWIDHADTTRDSAAAELVDAETRSRTLAVLYASGELDEDAYLDAKTVTDRRSQEARRRLESVTDIARLAQHDPLAVIGADWRTYPIDVVRIVIQAVAAAVTIERATPGRRAGQPRTHRYFDSDRITITWR